MGNRRLPPQVVILGLAALLNDAASEMVYPLLPLFLTTLGATPLVIGLIEGTADALASVLKFLAGSWSDRLRRRKPLVVGGYALAAASRIFIAVASAWSVVLSARLMDRTGKGIRSAPRDALIADVAEPGQRGRAFGFHRALDHTGAVIGPLVALLLLQGFAFSMRQVFFFAVIPGAIGVLLLVFALREKGGAPVSPAQPETDAGEAAGAPLRPPFRRVVFAVALFSLANSSDAFLILQAHAAGVSVAMLPLLWAAHHVVKAMFSTWAGGLSDRLGRRRLIVAGWASYAVVYALFPFANSLTAFVALFIAYAIPFTLSEGPERALISDLAPAGAKGRAFGIYYLVTGGGVLVGSVLFGLLYQSLSPAAAFGTASALALVAAVVISDNARMLRSAVILILAIVAVPAVAQLPLSESIEVRVVNVEVVVTDAAGKPVTGLSRDDFEILEDGKQQTITNLYEVRNGEPVASGEDASAAPPAAPRRFVFFIDNDSLHPYKRRQIVASLEKFIDAHVQPGDLTSVVMWNRSLSVLAPLTDDRRLLAAAIKRVAEGGSGASIKTQTSRVQAECVRVLGSATTGAVPPYVAYQECISILRGEMQATALKSRQLLNAVELTLTTIAGSEGRKILVLAGALLPKNPGEEIYQWANHLYMPYMTGFDSPNQRPDQEDEQTEYLEKVARSANAHGVTLYTIAAVVSSSLEGPEFARAHDDLGADYLNQANTFAAHEVLSGMTGGLSLNRPKDFDAAFATIARDSQSFYSLGYRPTTTTGGDRALTVRARNRDYTTRARQSHQMKTADELMSDRVVANIFVPAASSAWPAKVATGDPEKSGQTFKVPFEIVAPAQITLLPNGDTLTGGYTVYVAVGTAQGALSTVFRQPQSVELAPAQEAAFRKEPLTFGATLTVRPGENILSIGVVDRVSGATSFARTLIVAR